MYSSKNENWTIKRWLVMAFICLIVPHFIVLNGLAQTPTPLPTLTATPAATVTPGVTVTPIPNERSNEDFARMRAVNEEVRRELLGKSGWYYLFICILFSAVLFTFVWAIYRGTSGSPATKNLPLGLPVGSFRAILAYSLVAYLGFYVITSVLTVSQFAPSDFLLGIVATVIGFYFGSRSGEEGDTSLKTGTVRGLVRQDTNPARGAIIRLRRNDDGSEPYSRISDLDGRFVLSGVKPGVYRVSALITGFPEGFAQPDVSVAEGSDHEIEIIIRGAVTSPPHP